MIGVEMCLLLTSTKTQCVQMMPTTTVPIDPNTRPLFLKANGMASTPVPRLPLSKCIRAPKSLQNHTGLEDTNHRQTLQV
jgi:hypothetical protein